MEFSSAKWISVRHAAQRLELKEVGLRRMLARNAQRLPDGTIEARLDGLIARKIGRIWRVWLAPAWSSPGSSSRGSR